MRAARKLATPRSTATLENSSVMGTRCAGHQSDKDQISFLRRPVPIQGVSPSP